MAWDDTRSLGTNIMSAPTAKACPCDSHKNYTDCCAPYLTQQKSPASAEALMRSRYTAYSQKNENYLLASWHPSTRPMSLNLSERSSQHWQNLTILFTEKGQPLDNTGVVAFIARYLEGNELQHLCEKSRFEKLDGRWYYLDGDILSLSKNGPCPCQSGKKFKRCCGK